MDLINRYVYAVISKLPKNQREDIERELRALIDEMLEQYQGQESYESKVKKVLMELGDPDELANNYRGSKRYLIGPENYDKYFLILKIVFGAVLIGISVATAIGIFTSPGKGIAEITGDYIGTLFMALLQGFAWVTIAFALVERNKLNAIGKERKKEAWSISQLPVIPHKKAMIPMGGPIVSIIFSTIFLSILYFAPQLFAAYISNGAEGRTIIPLFDLDVLLGYKLLFAFAFVFTVAKEVVKLISGRWTFKVAIVASVLSLVSTLLMIVVFSNPHIWNPNLASDLNAHMNLNIGLTSLVSNLSHVVVAIMLFACTVEIISSISKGIRFSLTK